MASTFIRAFAIMLALTGFSAATTYSGGAIAGSSSRGVHANVMGGGGLGGAPICTTPPSQPCGLD